MHLRLLKLHPNAIIPKYQHDGDSGVDLHAIEPVAIAPHKTALIKTGLAAEIPIGTELQIRPRSGLALKQSVTVLNSPGTIDANYRGEIGVILINHSDTVFEVKAGMRIAQMVMVPVMHLDITVVDKVSDTSRGTGGFGSTGT
ncbi:MULTISPECIES: dUTP diphosphatase [Cyanophyceae]|uniref:dUTP diphosphatase n=1 Tax=Cyanophyceae TaxID=3028117 RepID=UPI0004AA2917|nr:MULTISPECIES: dUTP diphosphatase [Cyanophyceae]AMA07998.1 deoxyuridine 5'-triphosphate nucleotidohydrolase [Picosynechococcus sp. PCC 73109]ANV86136.1 deoxyuridine 5'-triphosphate nucleotidohydrolase [Picosynechococcus sp. PCC 7117]ANV89313.1 deoxyuridine 5'-triphosphate nucleotidohydrolase [Picosynechococcus sp. PCC 8807]QCS48811.1 dUTP diphosphatase [Picosynechococcus sp. PCC 11901]